MLYIFNPRSRPILDIFIAHKLLILMEATSDESFAGKTDRITERRQFLCGENAVCGPQDVVFLQISTEMSCFLAGKAVTAPLHINNIYTHEIHAVFSLGSRKI